MTQVEKVFLGPPGTGKTTTLINTVEQEMENGVPPDRIAFVSFTKKAAEEAVTRACERFNLTPRDFPYFRTLHSLTFRELGLRRGDVIGKTQYEELSAVAGFEFTGYYNNEDGMSGGRDGDKLLFLDTLARTRRVSIKEQWEILNPDISFNTAQQFHDIFTRYRKDVAMLDYTDFLEHYLIQCEPLNVEVAIIDEAQDLSSLQWEVVRHATRNAKRVYIAGDDDQAIYEWSGADVDYFLNLSGEKTVLNKSYRLPRNIFNAANVIVDQIETRYKKQWEPHSEGGSVHHHTDPEYIDFSAYDGNWLLLARNNYFLTKLRDLVEEHGLIYNFRGKNSVDANHVQAIKAWEHLRKGNELDDENTRLLESYIKGSQDIGAPWYVAFTGLSQRARNYYRSVLARKGTLNGAPEATISAIHGVKGGEADNVLLLTDMAYSSHTALQNNPDSEHRVFYVGATRARKRLHVVSPQTNRFYEM